MKPSIGSYPEIRKVFLKLFFVLTMVPALLMLSSCCDDIVRLGAVIGKDNREIIMVKEKGAGYEIWICPGTPVTLGWYLGPKIKEASIDNGIGSVQMPYATTTVYPQNDVTYTLTAKNKDCDYTSSVKIHIVKDGTPATINVPLVKRSELITSSWDTYLDPLFYDPHIKITSISISNDNFGGVTPGWTLRKKDINGALGQYLVIRSVPSTPSGFPIQLAGNHSIVPFNPINSNWSLAPQIISETLTLECK